VFEWSRALAGRVIREAGSDSEARLKALYRIALGRVPTREEQAVLIEFLDRHAALIAGEDRPDKPALPTGVEATDERSMYKEAAFVDLVHSVVNSNDFAYRF
jgi:hypothetical protein